MQKKEIGIVSLFSGCGGLDLGFEQVGDYKTLWANDFKHEACETFRKHFGDIIVEGDIEQIDPYTDKTIPNCDLVLGGFPCQDFSIIWKRPGLNGERGNLYKSFLRFVDAKKPKAFVAENVKGILTANGKKAIKQIIEDFQNIEPDVFRCMFHVNKFQKTFPILRCQHLIYMILLNMEFQNTESAF